jgi:hypothetical protein
MWYMGVAAHEASTELLDTFYRRCPWMFCVLFYPEHQCTLQVPMYHDALNRQLPGRKDDTRKGKYTPRGRMHPVY